MFRFVFTIFMFSDAAEAPYFKKMLEKECSQMERIILRFLCKLDIFITYLKNKKMPFQKDHR